MAQNKKQQKDTEVEPDKSAVAEKEEEILKFWHDNNIFQKTLDTPAGEAPKGTFVFYDGPPFATGLPHYGHVLPGTIKDVIPRYQTMKGNYVKRQWGWDTHGVPVENLVQKELGVESKEDIEKLGIEVFNDAARKSVLRYFDDWKRIIPRLGRFVDMDDFYMTMTTDYTESIWWSFKELYKKNLAYEGFKSVHISPLLETSLSNFEANQAYKDITDISVYVKFELMSEPNTYLLAWTTTPWTLPGNVALAINTKIKYVKVKEGEQFYIVAHARMADVMDDKSYEIVEEVDSKDLIAQSYRPVFTYYSDSPTLEHKENGWKVYDAEFVGEEDGTGIVHIAPAFGEDDLTLGRKENLPFVQHVSINGKIKDEVVPLAGLQAKPKATDEEPNKHQETDIEVIKLLAHAGFLFAKKKFVHSYPHCWRTGAPLLNYAMNSWYVKVTDIKEKMISENDKVSWVPEEIGSNRFGNWLKDAHDWGVSRSRYWGTTLPVWKSEDGSEVELIGSIEELKEKTKSTNTYFGMRHGEAESNVTHTATSSVDAENHITALGKDQVLGAANILKEKGGVDYIISSDILRTKETTELVAKVLGLSSDKILYDSRLREFSFGDYENVHLDEYRSYYKNFEERFEKPLPNGESYTDVKKRIGECMYEIDTQYKNKKILIVTHSTPLWLLLSVTQGKDVSQTIESRGEGKYFVPNAEIVSLPFSPLPHNEKYELDLHRPYIDTVTWVSQKGNVMKRVPDVFDTWYDSGSMPFASVHYPFENKESFERSGNSLFPADFIAEGLDQTRGWFYTLLVLGVAHFNQSPYKNVVVHGLVLAEDGKKMSKSLKNYPDLMTVVNKYGADALRYYLLSSPVVRGESVAFSEKGVDEVVKKIILRLKNVASFYEMYKEKESKEQHNVASKNILDVWILSRLSETHSEITHGLDSYQLDRATRPFLDFVDDLSTWYLRRSRDRFKGEDTEDTTNALATLRRVLEITATLLAPTMPFLAEELYSRSGGERESVHLEVWPQVIEKDVSVLERMTEVRKVVSIGLEKRAQKTLKVRQPLQSVSLKDTFLQDKDTFLQLVRDELNVKEVLFDSSQDEVLILDTTITKALQEEGMLRDIIRGVQSLRKDMSLTPDQKIKLTISVPEEVSLYVKKNESTLSIPTNIESINYQNILSSPQKVISAEGGDINLSINQ